MEITPHPFGEILAEGMTMLARVWRRLFAPAFWAFLALGGLTIATFALTDSDEFLELVLTNPEAIEAMTDAELLEPALRLLQTVLIAVIFQLLASGFVTLTAHLLVALRGAPEHWCRRRPILRQTAHLGDRRSAWLRGGRDRAVRPDRPRLVAGRPSHHGDGCDRPRGGRAG
jgi:hypothetical protein